MVSMETIRAELKSIRYYYERKSVFDQASDCVGKSAILDTIARYNAIICIAEPKFYELYVCLYVNCNTQEAAACILNYSPNYIYKLNKRLLQFFYEHFNRKEA